MHFLDETEPCLSSRFGSSNRLLRPVMKTEPVVNDQQ